MLILGLTGSFGSGKSTAAAIMEEMGAVVVDADRLAREAVEPGREAHGEIVEMFGANALDSDGKIDRAELARLVFTDPLKRKALEAIVHPRVRIEMRRRIEEAEAGDVVALDVPLLFENGLDAECDKTCVVAIGEAERIERLARRGVDEDEVGRRLAAQMPQDEKARRADYVIDNSSDLEAFRLQIGRLMDEFKILATQ